MKEIDPHKRRIIPRWRRFDEAASTSELSSNPNGKPKLIITERDTFLEAKLAEWEIGPTIGLAVDILSSAVVLGRTKEFERFAWWILTRDEQYSGAVLDLAKLCAYGPSAVMPKAQQNTLEARALLRRCRAMLADNPHDAVLRTDTAFAMALMGNSEKAEKQMAAAVHLAPDNRFVLRSAARFWIHRHDPEHARHVLLNSQRTGVDPWLLSSEVSISLMAGKSPRYIGRSRVILHERRGNPNQLSELAGAVGTIEALNGSRKTAQNFFNQSIIDPTENAVAQAVWAANEKVLPGFDADRFKHLKPAEADAWQARANLNWPAAMEACHRWGAQEPFSVQPFMMGSFIASMMDDHAESKLFCTNGLMANPGDYTLANNLAVAHFFEGNVESALAIIESLSQTHKNSQERAVWLATTGLALMYSGDIEAGREAYRKAIDAANEHGHRMTAVYAAAFWVKAELANDSSAKDALEIFHRLTRGITNPEIQYFKERFKDVKPE